MGKKKDVLERIKAKEDALVEYSGNGSSPVVVSKDPVTDLTPNSPGSNTALEFRFEDLAEKSKSIRKIHQKIERELYIDTASSIERLGHTLVKSIRKITRQNVLTVAELFDQAAEELGGACELLGSLYAVCNSNYESVAAYCERNDIRLEKMFDRRPGMVAQVNQSQKAYAEAARVLAGLSRSDPRHYAVRRKARKLRDASHNSSFSVHMLDHLTGMVENITVHADTVSQFLLRGRDFSQKLGCTYAVAQECINEVGAGSNLVRELFRSAGVLYNLVSDVSETMRYAHTLVTDFDSPRLVAKAYREIPLLPQNKRTEGILDYINGQFQSGQGRKLLTGR